MQVHPLDVRSTDGASHGAPGAGVNGSNSPCLAVVIHQMTAREAGFLRDDKDVCCGVFSTRQRQLYTNHVGSQSGDSCDVRCGFSGGHALFPSLDLMNSPEHIVFFEDVADDEFFVGINHENHPLGPRSIGEDEGNVGRRRGSEFHGVNVLADVAANHEVGAVSDFFLPQDVVCGHVVTRRAVGGVFQDVVFIVPRFLLFHGASPSLP